MPESFINILELAEALGLSKSTVSRAFRNKSDISEKTKKYVLEKAKELGYYPNIYASNLRDSKSKTVAVVMPELANNYFSLAVKGIEKVVQANGYHTLIYVTDSRYEKEAEIVATLFNRRVEGIIMSVSGEGADHDYIDKLKKNNIPLVFFDRVYEDVKAPKVVTDDYDSSRNATQYFLDNGCKRIAFLVIDKNVSIGKTRLAGFLDAHKANGVTPDPRLIVDCSNDLEASYQKIKHVLKEYRPEAIVSSVERLATTAYQVCLDEHIRIPDEVRIISYTNIQVAALLNPALSTIEQPAEEVGECAARLLLNMLNKKIRPGKTTVLPSKIIHRTSTAFAR
jgi:LacI family transcriptional regulator